MTKRFLITGGCGFIGSQMVNLCLKKGYKVFNVDKLTYASNKKTILDKNYYFKKIDICDYNKLSKVVKRFKPNYIINFAAETHVDNSIKNPYPFYESNIFGVINILEIIKSINKQIKFIQISTDEVFGKLNIRESSFTESSKYNPQSPYSASKAAADHIVKSYANTYNIKFNITYSSNNYGEGQHEEKFIPVIINNCLNNKYIPIYGKGQNVRNWVHVEDNCKAILKVAVRGSTNESYAIGSDFEVSNLKLAKLICKKIDKILGLSNRNKLLKFVKDRAGHDFRYSINFNKIKKELNWKPEIKFDEGINVLISKYISKRK